MIYLIFNPDGDPDLWYTANESNFEGGAPDELSIKSFETPRECRRWVLKQLEERKKHIGRVMEKWYKCDWMDIRSQKTTTEVCSKETTRLDGIKNIIAAIGLYRISYDDAGYLCINTDNIIYPIRRLVKVKESWAELGKIISSMRYDYVRGLPVCKQKLNGGLQSYYEGLPE
jgi:hypothetical protein